MCPECRAATTAYMREYRQRPGKAEQNRAMAEAARRAQRRLAKMHPAMYRALYLEELDKITRTEASN